MTVAARDATTIAWISRHRILPAQLRWLRNRFGDIRVVFIRDTFADAEELYRRVKAAGAKYAVVVLPLSVIARLVKYDDVTWLWSEMEIVHKDCPGPDKCELFNPETDAWLPGGRRHVRFATFKKIKDVRLELEDF